MLLSSSLRRSSLLLLTLLLSLAFLSSCDEDKDDTRASNLPHSPANNPNDPNNLEPSPEPSPDHPDARDGDDLGVEDAFDLEDANPGNEPDASDMGDVGSGGEWASLAPIAGGSRQENSVLALGGEVFVLGGFRGFQVVAEVESFDPVSGVWTQRASLPERMHHINAAVVGGKIYVLGYLVERSFTPNGRSYVYDPSDDTWSPVARMPEEEARGASAVGVMGGKVYVAGGLRGGAVDDFSVYDPSDDTWTTLPDLPARLDHLVGGVIDGVFYVSGGRERRISAHRPSMYAFDPDLGVWESRSPLLTSRAGHAGVVFDGRFLVFGGEGSEDDPNGVFDQVEMYDPTEDAWTSLAPMITRRHGTGAAEVGGKIYVPGGADVLGFGSIDVHEVFTPPSR